MAARASDIFTPYLRSWRADKGMSQDHLAARAGVTRGTIMRAENGKAINVVTLAKIAKALGISVHTLRFTDPSLLTDESSPTRA